MSSGSCGGHTHRSQLATGQLMISNVTGWYGYLPASVILFEVGRLLTGYRPMDLCLDPFKCTTGIIPKA